MIGYHQYINDTRSVIMKKLCMAVLSAYPIICYFKVGSYFNYASLLGLLLFIIGVGNGLFKYFRFSKPYFVFWAYQWVVIALFSGYFGLNMLIPGGLEFFVASLGVAVFAAFFDMNLLRKYTNILFVIAGGIFLFQFIYQLLTGNIIPIYPHIGNELTYCGMNYTELLLHHSVARRPCSIFPEPAYFSIFCCFSLTLELFCENNLKKPFTPLAVAMGAMVLLSKSGTGLITLTIIGIIKLIQFSLIAGKKKNILFLLLFLPALFFGIRYYINSEIGLEMLSRTKEFSGDGPRTSGYQRVVQGIIVYNNLDSTQKLFGTTSEYRSYLGDNHIFLNGISDTLITLGALGLLCQILLFSKSCKGKQFVVIAYVLIFYTVSFIEAMNNFGLGYIATLVIASTLFLEQERITD